MKLECFKVKNSTGKTYHYRLVVSQYTHHDFCGSAYYGNNSKLIHFPPGMTPVHNGKPLTACKNCQKGVTKLAMETHRFSSEVLPVLVKSIENTVHEYDMAESVFGHALLQTLHNT